MGGNTKVEAKQNASLERLKWLFVWALVAAAIFGNLYFSDFSFLYRVLGVVGVGALAAVLAVSTQKGRGFWQLLKDARIEIRKVVWPTKQETLQTTLVVVVFVFIAAIILWGFDTLLGWLTTMFIG